MQQKFANSFDASISCPFDSRIPFIPFPLI